MKSMIALLLAFSCSYATGLEGNTDPIVKVLKGEGTMTYLSGQEFQTKVQYELVYTALTTTLPQRSTGIGEVANFKFKFGPFDKVVAMKGERLLQRSFEGGTDREITVLRQVLVSEIQTRTSNGVPYLSQYRISYDLDSSNLSMIESSLLFEEIVFTNSAQTAEAIVVKSLPLQ